VSLENILIAVVRKHKLI